MSSANFDRMDRVEIIEEISNIDLQFGQMFGQNSVNSQNKRRNPLRLRLI